MNILDEVYGATGWKREHVTINGNLFCTVSVYDESKKEWITKQDVGTESNTEKVKGEASDSFKRACVNIGIGRELYTAPRVYINLTPEDFNNNGKLKTSFHVSKITYTASREIDKLEIVDNYGVVRFPQTETQKTTEKKTTKAKAVNTSVAPENTDTTTEYPKAVQTLIDKCKSVKELENIWNGYPAYQRNQKFIRAINAKKKTL